MLFRSREQFLLLTRGSEPERELGHYYLAIADLYQGKLDGRGVGVELKGAAQLGDRGGQLVQVVVLASDNFTVSEWD